MYEEVACVSVFFGLYTSDFPKARLETPRMLEEEGIEDGFDGFDALFEECVQLASCPSSSGRWSGFPGDGWPHRTKRDAAS